MIPLVKVGMPERTRLLPALEKVLYSGMIAEGDAVYDFEHQFAQQFALNNCLAMSSGTAALHAALALAGVKAGDEVISTPMTAEPTNTSILYCGAQVVWADVDPLTGNIDPASVLERITPKTKAIVCVHYAGYPAKLVALKKIAAEHQLALIEDCAHALGARYGSQHVGTLGDYGIYSFQAIKHMTTVDGGMLTFSDTSKIEEGKRFRWFGMLKGVPRTEMDIHSVGYKYNMNNVQATIGLVQLEGIRSLLNAHQDNGIFYDQALSNISGIEVVRSEPVAHSSYWIYTLLCDDAQSLEERLNASGISASKLHRPNNLHRIFANAQTDLPGLSAFYQRLLHIPCGWWVSHADRERIVDLVRQG